MTIEQNDEVRVTAKPLVALIRFYQKLVSPSLGKNCRFTPTCSSYAMGVLSRFGVLRGTWMTVKRIGRCNPLVPGGYDPVPTSMER